MVIILLVSMIILFISIDALGKAIKVNELWKAN